MGAKLPKAELRDRTRYWVQRLRAKPNVIRVQPMKNKWGSCSRRGVITLASDLASESEAFQDAVIVHELLHLKVRNHGRLFKALMTAHVPQWRRLQIQGCRFQQAR